MAKKLSAMIWAYAIAIAMAAGIPATAASYNINVNAIARAVVYLYDPANNEVGTGFLVSVPLISDPTKGYVSVFTARHMLDREWAHCSGANPTVIYARLNKTLYDPTNGYSKVFGEAIPLTLVGPNGQTWFHHRDDDIDAAAIPLGDAGQILRDFDSNSISISDFATDEEAFSADIGDFVVTAGLLVQIVSLPRNYPIFKFGQISNKPSDDVETWCEPNLPSFKDKVWFIAANLVKGNSGSPIFKATEIGASILVRADRPVLLGLQSMAYLGSDVAGMTPVKYLYEMLQDLQLPDADMHRGVPNQSQH